MAQKGTEIPQIKEEKVPADCPVPSPCPVCPPKPKPTQILLKILLVLGMALFLAVLILVGSGLRISQKESLLDIWLASRRGISPTPEISQPTPTPDPTANWQTYANSKYGFEFKYPADWEVREANYTGYLGSFIIEPKENGIGELTIYVDKDKYLGTVVNGKKVTCVEWAASWVGKGLAIRDLEVGGVAAKRVSLPGGQNPAQDLVCLESGKAYEFQFIPNTRSATNSIFDQILSTFEFVGEGAKVAPEPTAASLKVPQEKMDTSSWVIKSYPKMFVSFKLPTSWEEKEEGEFNFDNLVRRAMFDDPNWGLSFDFTVSLYNNPGGWGRREFWWREIAGSKESSYSEHGAKYVKDVTEWDIDGENALSLYFTEYSGGGTYFMIPRGNQMLVLFFNGQLGQNNKFETVVSTFKFLD